MGLRQMVAPCLGCYQRFRAASYEMAREPELAARVAEKIGYTYQGTVETLHAVEALLERAGLDAIRARVKKPLKGLRVASYYGCATTRPPRYTGAENPENPTCMDEVVEALGAEPIDWSAKTDCCGSSLGITRTPLALKLSAEIVKNARAYGADLIVTACPLCQVNVENRQLQMGLDFQIPVLYITQLMVLAFDLGERSAELNKNIVDPRPLLREKGLLGSR